MIKRSRFLLQLKIELYCSAFFCSLCYSYFQRVDTVILLIFLAGITALTTVFSFKKDDVYILRDYWKR